MIVFKRRHEDEEHVETISESVVRIILLEHYADTDSVVEAMKDSLDTPIIHISRTFYWCEDS